MICYNPYLHIYLLYIYRFNVKYGAIGFLDWLHGTLPDPSGTPYSSSYTRLYMSSLPYQYSTQTPKTKTIRSTAEFSPS